MLTYSDTENEILIENVYNRKNVWKLRPYGETVYLALHSEKFLNSWQHSWNSLIKNSVLSYDKKVHSGYKVM